MRKLLPGVGVFLIIIGAWWLRSGPAPKTPPPAPAPKIARTPPPPPAPAPRPLPPPTPPPMPKETIIRGRVVSSGLPVTTAEVALANLGMVRDLIVTSPTVVKTHPDPDGKFEFRKVELGTYRVTANAPGLALGWTDVDVRTTEEVIDIEVDLHPGTSLEIQVLSDGKPIEATVSVWTSLPGTEYNRKGRPLRTGPTRNGLFVAESMPRTPLIFLVLAPDHRAHEQVVERVTETVIVTLQQGLKLSGSVVDHQGRPISNVTITATQGEAYVPEFVTRDDGAFSFGGLVSRTATLLFRKDGFDMVRLEVKVPSSGIVVTLRTLGVLELDVDWPGAVTLLLRTPAANFRHKIATGRVSWTNLPTGPATLMIENGKGEVIGRLEVVVPEFAPDTPMKVVPKK